MPEEKPRARCCVSHTHSGVSEALEELMAAGFEVTATPVSGLADGIEVNLSMPDGTKKTLTSLEEIHTVVEEYKLGKYGKYQEEGKYGK